MPIPDGSMADSSVKSTTNDQPKQERLEEESHDPAPDAKAQAAESVKTQQQRRPKLSKFATIHADIYPQAFTRDFPLTNFDRNLTVEKARFEPRPHNPSADAADDSLSQATTPHSEASFTNLAGKTSQQKQKKEADRRSAAKKRKRTRPPMSGTATPSEVFHRNLIDAVSNVEDSDENEQYVYPYVQKQSGYGYRSPSSPSLSAVYSAGRLNPLNNTFFNDIFRRRSSPSLADEHQHHSQQSHRPKLRTYVMDHRQQQPTGSDSWTLYDKQNKMDHRTGAKVPTAAAAAAAMSRARPKVYPELYHADGYSSDDEDAPLLYHRTTRFRSSGRNRRRLWPRILCNVLLAIMILVFCSAFLILSRVRPLTDIYADMSRVLASDKELMFDLHVKARNPNWWTVQIDEADISVFAFSQLVLPPTSNDTVTEGVDPAEYLGSFYKFDEPLVFPSSLFSGELAEGSSQIRIKSPGADRSGNNRWSRIIRYRYGLVARGVLKYRAFPLGDLYPQSAAICDVVHVEPTSGTIDQDPDQSFCFKDKVIPDHQGQDFKQGISCSQ